MPLLAELLSIPDGRRQPLPLTPAQRKAATIALLVDEIVRLGETDPVLLVLEDAHWIDATTLEMMTRLADSIGAGAAACRGDRAAGFRAALAGAAARDVVDARRLGRAECAELVAGVAAAHGLSAETVAAIVAKTDGVPLFAEELTKSVMELAGEDSAAVPATLKDSLMARLDRLGEAREVAQIAAVIGRQFAFSLLDAVVAERRRRARGSAGEAGRGGNRLSRRARAGAELQLQACAGARRRLRELAAWPAARMARAHRPRAGRALSRDWRRTSRSCWPIISARPDWPGRLAIIACAPATRP